MSSPCNDFSKCIDHRSAWLMELTKALCLLREGWILTLPTSPGLQAIFQRVAQFYQVLNFDGCAWETKPTLQNCHLSFFFTRKHAHHGWHVGLRKSGQVDKFKIRNSNFVWPAIFYCKLKIVLISR